MPNMFIEKSYLENQEPRGKPTRYELENTFKKLRGKPRGIKPSGGIKEH